MFYASTEKSCVSPFYFEKNPTKKPQHNQKYSFLLQQSRRNLGWTSYQSYEDKCLIHNCSQSRDKVAGSLLFKNSNLRNSSSFRPWYSAAHWTGQGKKPGKRNLCSSFKMFDILLLSLVNGPFLRSSSCSRNHCTTSQPSVLAADKIYGTR